MWYQPFDLPEQQWGCMTAHAAILCTFAKLFSNLCKIVGSWPLLFFHERVKGLHVNILEGTNPYCFREHSRSCTWWLTKFVHHSQPSIPHPYPLLWPSLLSLFLISSSLTPPPRMRTWHLLVFHGIVRSWLPLAMRGVLPVWLSGKAVRTPAQCKVGSWRKMVEVTQFQFGWATSIT